MSIRSVSLTMIVIIIIAICKRYIWPRYPTRHSKKKRLETLLTPHFILKTKSKVKLARWKIVGEKMANKYMPRDGQQTCSLVSFQVSHRAERLPFTAQKVYGAHGELYLPSTNVHLLLAAVAAYPLRLPFKGSQLVSSFIHNFTQPTSWVDLS